MLKAALRSLARRCLASRFGPLSLAAWNLVSEVRITLATIFAHRAFHQLRNRMHLKVHLGCGDDIREGWVNIDLNPKRQSCHCLPEKSDTVVISYDLRLGLPLRPSSCDYIYSSHLIEHLEPQAGLRLLRDCFSALRPGGTCRIVLPDYRSAFSAYLNGDVEYFQMLDETGEIREFQPGTKTLIDQVDYAVHQYGQHRCIYDSEKLVIVLRAIGYRDPCVSMFRPDVDHPSPIRQQYSLYLEATK
jgi:SAM-dependent methyltransferase